MLGKEKCVCVCGRGGGEGREEGGGGGRWGEEERNPEWLCKLIIVSDKDIIFSIALVCRFVC